MASARLSMVYISLQCIELTDINFELILKQMIRTGCDFYVSLYEKLGPHIVITILTKPAPPPIHKHTLTPRAPKQDFPDFDKLTLIGLSRRAMEFEWQEGVVQEAP